MLLSMVAVKIAGDGACGPLANGKPAAFQAARPPSRIETWPTPAYFSVQ